MTLKCIYTYPVNIQYKNLYCLWVELELIYVVYVDIHTYVITILMVVCIDKITWIYQFVINLDLNKGCIMSIIKITNQLKVFDTKDSIEYRSNLCNNDSSMFHTHIGKWVISNIVASPDTSYTHEYHIVSVEYATVWFLSNGYECDIPSELTKYIADCFI